jgi:Tfp pilus assembly protein PilX
MNRTKESGVGLILALILLLVLSVMAASFMFLSQTETWSSLNYRLMSQARDGAEAGVNKAANFLLYSYTPPAPGGGDPITAYTLTALPVTYSASPVVLSANSNVTSNYPVGSVQTSFNAAGHGSLTAGNTSVSYATTATLLSMRQVSVYGSPTPVTIQTWLLTSDGNISGIRNAQVEVSAIMERAVAPAFNYAAFATNNGCSALTFGGGGTTDSYDSSTVVNGSVTTQADDGNVGTNGNLTTGGSPTTINGSLSTPRTGVGTCTTNNVTAWTDNQGHVTGGVIELPQPVVYPPPTIPPPGTTDLSLTKNWSCPSGANAIPGCSSSGSNITIPPGSYGNINISGQANLHLSVGTYNINSLSEQSAQSGIIIDSGPVILNVTGNNVSGAVVNLTGNSVQNPSLVPTNFQIMYAGTGTISLKGNSQASGLLYAPNASFSFAGQGSWYGAVVGAFMTDMGGAAIHYDRRLKNSNYILGNYMLSSFTWKKY